MSTHLLRKRAIAIAIGSFMLASWSGIAAAQTTRESPTTANPPANSRVLGNERQDTAQQVREATKVVGQMERDPGMKKLLQQAKGVFIVPDYGRVALGVGGRGGEGVVLIKHGNTWSDPAFYNIGGISVGLQAGAEAGSIAMVLNSDKAVKTFMQNNNFSLNAEAGLTVVNWSGKAQASAGKGDVVIWSDTEGLFGGATASVTDINFDEDETAGYYGKQVAVRDIFNGKVRGPAQANMLKQALAGKGSSSTATGSSGTQQQGESGGASSAGSSGTGGNSGTSGK